MGVCLLHNEELYILCSSPNIIRWIDRGWQEVRDIFHAWKRREMLTEFWSRNLNERARLESMDVNGRIMLECILQK
jgi:hypothetical protein